MATGFRYLLSRRNELFSICPVFFAGLIFVYGCTAVKEVEQIEEHPGLETIPHYRKDTFAYNSRLALKRLEVDKEAEESRLEELREMVEERAAEAGSADPWVPPPWRCPLQLPIALRYLPKDEYGYPDWQEAVRREMLKPRDSKDIFIDEEREEEAERFEEDIIFEINDRLMANVRFSHRVHNYYLSCKACHPAIFKDKKGANPATMYDIWEGERCGRCHGTVAFQPKGFENCKKCHSEKKRTMGIR
jgi:c(7)-type cytochrome triheme protein